MGDNDTFAIVTGGGRGIGRAIALALAADGYGVGVADIDWPAATCVVDTLVSAGHVAVPIGMDVRSSSNVNRLVSEFVDQFGRIDVLVTNAGITGRDAQVVELTDEEWLGVLAVDLNGVFFCTRAVLRHMLRVGKGSIVNIASIAGKEGNPKMAAYSAAKGAVIAFTKSVAKEVARQGIFVHCIAPAVIETELLDQLTPQQVQYMLDRVPLGRFGKPEEVGELVRFLVSDRFKFSTGACFDLSGGRAVY